MGEDGWIERFVRKSFDVSATSFENCCNGSASIARHPFCSSPIFPEANRSAVIGGEI